MYFGVFQSNLIKSLGNVQLGVIEIRDKLGNVQLGVIEIRDKGYKSLMHCHQYFFGGKHDLIPLYRQIMHQNDGMSMRNSLKPSPPAFSI